MKLDIKPSLKYLFWITILNYFAQIPYYLLNYYFPYHRLPTFSAFLLLGLTLVWFLLGYFGFIRGLKYGRLLLVSFLSAEALFYLHSFIFGAFIFQMQNPHPIIKSIFLIGYIAGGVAGYYVYQLVHSKKFSS